MALPINPGTILFQPLCKVIGGKTRKTHKRAEGSLNGGAGEFQEYDVKVETPDKDERDRAEALVAKGTTIIRSRTQHTLIGYLGDGGVIAKINAEYAKLRTAADTFNANAKFSQIKITYAPIEIGPAIVGNEDVAKALADHVRTELSDLVNKLRLGDVDQVRNVLLRCKRMHYLSVGTQADAIKFAIEEGASALGTLRNKIKNNETAESAGRSLAVPMIESAIETFTYASERHTPELPAGALEPEPVQVPAQLVA